MNEREIELAEILWNYHHLPCELQKSDLIIGLGSYDTRVAKHCAELLANDWAPLVIFTGAEGNFTRGKWPKSEAEMFAGVAIEAGAPPAQILIEPNATNTGENIRFTKSICEERELAVKRAIMVSKPNMNRRGFATFQQHWPTLEIFCSAPDTHFSRSPAPGYSPEEVVSEIVGDLQRIIEYPKSGFQAAQIIPDRVLAAYEKLVQCGYTSHMM
jgi:uncharacterized SAM-binding protein YcdF (DUF218 family)